jgi:hypothetical protein
MCSMLQLLLNRFHASSNGNIAVSGVRLQMIDLKK